VETGVKFLLLAPVFHCEDIVTIRLLPTAWRWLDPRDKNRDQKLIFDIPQKDVLILKKIKLSAAEMNAIHSLENGAIEQKNNVNHIYHTREDIQEAVSGKGHLSGWIPIIMMIIRKIKLSDSTQEIEMI
jgi:hypothetical protein